MLADGDHGVVHRGTDDVEHRLGVDAEDKQQRDQRCDHYEGHAAGGHRSGEGRRISGAGGLGGQDGCLPEDGLCPGVKGPVLF